TPLGTLAASILAMLLVSGIVWWFIDRRSLEPARVSAPGEPAAASRPNEAGGAVSGAQAEPGGAMSDSERAVTVARIRRASADAQASRPIPGLPPGVATGSGTPLSDLATYYVHWLANLDEQRQAARSAIPA